MEKIIFPSPNQQQLCVHSHIWKKCW